MYRPINSRLQWCADLVILTCVGSLSSHNLNHTLTKKSAPDFPDAHWAYAWLVIQWNKAARHRYLIGGLRWDLIVHTVYEIFNTNMIFLIPSPNFSIHPCKYPESMPPVPAPPGSFCATELTTSYLIPTGIKIGVSSWNLNVEQWDFLSSGCFPTRTSATVLFINPIMSVTQYPGIKNPPVSRSQKNQMASCTFLRRIRFEKVRWCWSWVWVPRDLPK